MRHVQCFGGGKNTKGLLDQGQRLVKCPLAPRHVHAGRPNAFGTDLFTRASKNVGGRGHIARFRLKLGSCERNGF